MKLFQHRDKFKITNPIAILEWILLALLTTVIAGLLIFWHRYFYQSIVQAEIILVLSKEVALRDIDLEKFNKVLAAHQFKTGNLLPKNISNPF